MLFALDQERRAAWMSSYRVPSHVDWLLVMMAGAAWCSEHQPRPADEAAYHANRKLALKSEI